LKLTSAGVGKKYNEKGLSHSSISFSSILCLFYFLLFFFFPCNVVVFLFQLLFFILFYCLLLLCPHHPTKKMNFLSQVKRSLLRVFFSQNVVIIMIIIIVPLLLLPCPTKIHPIIVLFHFHFPLLYYLELSSSLPIPSLGKPYYLKGTTTKKRVNTDTTCVFAAGFIELISFFHFFCFNADSKYDYRSGFLFLFSIFWFLFSFFFLLLFFSFAVRLL
jgi:hypothetical protein